MKRARRSILGAIVTAALLVLPASVGQAFEPPQEPFDQTSLLLVLDRGSDSVLAIAEDGSVDVALAEDRILAAHAAAGGAGTDIEFEADGGTDIAVDADGIIYFTARTETVGTELYAYDPFADSVEVIITAAEFMAEVGGDQVSGLAFAPDGTLWATEDDVEQAITIDVEAGTAASAAVFGTASPGGAIGGDGFFYVLDQNADAVDQVQPDGTVTPVATVANGQAFLTTAPDGSVTGFGEDEAPPIAFNMELDGTLTTLFDNADVAAVTGDAAPALEGGLAYRDDGLLFFADDGGDNVMVYDPADDSLSEFVAASAIQAATGVAPDLRAGMAFWIDPTPPTPAPGYRMVASDGGVFTFGERGFHGSLGDVELNQPIFGGATNPATLAGYWMVAADGGVFSFGDAVFHGSLGDRRLSAPITEIEPTPTGEGYWLVDADGEVFPFGDAKHFGDASDINLNQGVIGMATTSTGMGYWLVASDGGIFAFGDAEFYGSTGGMRLNAPVVDLAALPDDSGYYLVATDGGVFAFNAPFMGSAGNIALNSPAVAMLVGFEGDGYWIGAADGGVFTYGNVPFLGSMGHTPLNGPVLDFIP